MRPPRLRTSVIAMASLGMAAEARSTPIPSSSVPIVRMAELEIDPAQRTAYDRLLAEEIETSVRVEPGVLSLNAISVKGRPASVRIMEIYADQAAYEAHIHSPHFLRYKTGTAGMVRSLVLIEGDPIALHSKPSRAGQPE